MALQWSGMSRKSFFTGDKAPLPRDCVKMHTLEQNVFHRFRLIGPPVAIGMHRIAMKKKDSDEKGGNPWPRTCLGVDPFTGHHSPEKCPYCTELGNHVGIEIYQNAIDRDKQKNRPEKKGVRTAKEKKLSKFWGGDKREGYFAEPDSQYWSPVAALRLTSSVAGKIPDFVKLNAHRLKSGVTKTYDPDHPTKGFDFNLKFDKSAKKGADMYTLAPAIGTGKVLSEAELAYLLQDLTRIKPQTYEAAMKDAKWMKSRLWHEDKPASKDSDDIDADDKKSSKRDKVERNSGNGSRTDKRRYDPDDDEDDDTIDAGDDDAGAYDPDEDDEPPKLKKSSRGKAKTSSKSSKASGKAGSGKKPSSKVSSKASSKPSSSASDKSSKASGKKAGKVVKKKRRSDD